MSGVIDENGKARSRLGKEPQDGGTRSVDQYLVRDEPTARRNGRRPLRERGQTSFRLLPFLPFRGRWVALITEFEWNHHFADVQQKGPFKSFQHRHQLARTTRDQVSGTIIRDVIDYEVGFGPLGELADKFFIAQQLQRTFAYRQSALVKLLS